MYKGIKKMSKWYFVVAIVLNVYVTIKKGKEVYSSNNDNVMI
jgi:hypothetical protein